MLASHSQSHHVVARSRYFPGKAILLLVLICCLFNQGFAFFPGLKGNVNRNLGGGTLINNNNGGTLVHNRGRGRGSVLQSAASESSSSSPPDVDAEDDDEDKISHELDVRYASFIRMTRLKPQPVKEVQVDFNQFGDIFRHSAPYIAMHRSNIVVIHIPGFVFSKRKQFQAIMDDISILHLLGVKLVLTIGVREQVDKRIRAAGKEPIYHDGVRCTDPDMMQILKEELGAARFEIESCLARGYIGMARQSGINVVSGNFFYNAKPMGVRNGVDYKLTGEVRRIDQDNFKKRLDDGDVILITSLGYSANGEVYNVASEELAAKCAVALKASKIIFLTHENDGLIDIRNGKSVNSLRVKQAVALMEGLAVPTNTYLAGSEATEGEGEAEGEENEPVDSYGYTEQGWQGVEGREGGEGGEGREGEGGGQGEGGEGGKSQHKKNPNINYVRLLAKCVYAVTGGVRRGHLVPASRGAVLKELYTRDGEGVLISGDTYEGIRPAIESDLRGVLEIIRPLETEGILVPRSAEDVSRELRYCFVMTRDNSTLACGMLRKFSDTHAEVYMLAVHPDYRKGGRGETLLAYLERRALFMGIKNVFLLSTRTMQWFEERGFAECDPSMLPPKREYNKSRGSKVYLKVLGSQRDVDTEELLWDV